MSNSSKYEAYLYVETHVSLHLPGVCGAGQRGWWTAGMTGGTVGTPGRSERAGRQTHLSHHCGQQHWSWFQMWSSYCICKDRHTKTISVFVVTGWALLMWTQHIAHTLLTKHKKCLICLFAKAQEEIQIHMKTLTHNQRFVSFISVFVVRQCPVLMWPGVERF